MLVVHTGTRLADGVGVPERVPVMVRELLRVMDDVRVPVPDLVEVFVTAEVAVNDRDTVDDGVCEPLTEAELDALEVPVVDPEAEAEADDVGEGVGAGVSCKPRPAHSSVGGSASTRESRGRAAAGTGVAPSLGRAKPDTAPHRRRANNVYRMVVGRICECVCALRVNALSYCSLCGSLRGKPSFDAVGGEPPNVLTKSQGVTGTHTPTCVVCVCAKKTEQRSACRLGAGEK